MKKITSKKNALIKKIIQLQQKSLFRKKSGKFVIEGKREISLAFEGNYKIEELLFVRDLVPNPFVYIKQKDLELIEITKEVYSKIAYREKTEGLIAIARQKDLSIEKLKLKNKNPLVLIAENIEKPGNIGAMLRTADAAGIDAFILLNPKTDIYNPNVIRASLGTVFTVNIGVGETNKIQNFLKKYNLKLFAATLQNSNPYFIENFTQGIAIAVGSEDKGLSAEIRKIAYKNIIIPMNGKIDSMNVSVSAAILIFEAVRQRKIKASTITN